MAEQILEALQSSHRPADYYPDSDDDEVLDIHPAKTTAKTPESAPWRNAPRTAPHPAPTFEPLFKSFENARGTTQLTPLPTHKQSTPLHAGLSTGRSLLDEMDDVSFELTPMFSQTSANATKVAPIAGVAGFLEIEEEPSRGGGGMYDDIMDDDAPSSNLPSGLFEDDDEPIRTNSGLILTHRRTPVMSRTNKSRPQFNNNYDDNDNKKYDIPFLRLPSAFRPATPSASSRGGGGGGNSQYFSSHCDSGDRGNSMALLQAKRLMSYVRLWVVFLFIFLLAATGVLVHSFRSANSDDGAATASGKQSKAEPIQRRSPGMADHIEDLPERIILVPIENASEWASRQHLLHEHEQPVMQIGHDTHNRRILKHNNKDFQEQHGVRRILLELRQEFETWADEHQKTYQSEHEKEQRFHIWANNHQR
jgi:hypothetical protein